MRISIIGAGAIGGTLARRLSALGHEVYISNSRGAETLRDFATEVGAIPAYVRETAEIGKIVIIAIQEGRIRELPKDLFKRITPGGVVVDTGNYYPQQRDGRIEAIENGLTESEWVADHLGRPVIKAFNNIYWKHLLEKGRLRGSPGRIALPVSGDDPIAKAIILDLIEELGFDAIDAGRLEESWRQQPGTPVYGTDLDAEGVRRALAKANPIRKSEWRALEVEAFDFERSG